MKPRPNDPQNEPQSNAAREMLRRYVPAGHKTYTPSQLVAAKAEGCWLETPEGRRLLDFTSGVLVANLGHAHPGFEDAYAQYAKHAPRNCYNAVSPLEPEAARRLVRNMDSPKMEKVLWADSGSAAVIKAIWAAQHARPERRTLLATRAGFHGKKGLAGDVTGTESGNPDVRFLSFPRGEVRDIDMLPETEANGETLRQPYLDELNRAKEERGDPLLLITEPYLGAAGSYHPPFWYLKTLSDWCAENDVLFILDEVQSCHGRTGEMYAYQRYGIEPDIAALGKGLGNGEPVAAAVGRADLLDSLAYGEASDTYSGNPRACAAVLAALDIFETQPVLDNCRRMSARLREGLRALRDEFETASAVRGEGMVWGLEMASDADAKRAVLECYRAGVHLLGPLAGNTLRVSPPLVISEEELEEGLKRMRAGLKEAANKLGGER